eukprot:m.213560 g.213560  ORF g.213560 m.213560 type:complete len:153 (+) comp15577_c0_seq9:622-1080(+)
MCLCVWVCECVFDSMSGYDQRLLGLLSHPHTNLYSPLLLMVQAGGAWCLCDVVSTHSEERMERYQLCPVSPASSEENKGMLDTSLIAGALPKSPVILSCSATPLVIALGKDGDPERPVAVTASPISAARGLGEAVDTRSAGSGKEASLSCES